MISQITFTKPHLLTTMQWITFSSNMHTKEIWQGNGLLFDQVRLKTILERFHTILTKQWYPMSDKNSKFAEEAAQEKFENKRKRKEEKHISNSVRKLLILMWFFLLSAKCARWAWKDCRKSGLRISDWLYLCLCYVFQDGAICSMQIYITTKFAFS